MSIVMIVLMFMTVPLLLLMLVLVLECIAAFFPPKIVHQGSRPPCVVLVPAHNEELVLEKTLIELKSQLKPGDRIQVVADNCNDKTAVIAKTFGIDVLERTDPNNRGKGFALDAGIEAIKTANSGNSLPEVVVIVDADCIMQPNCLDRLVRAVKANDAPVQALYLMDPPSNASVGTLVSTFAFIFKNHVRARGLAFLGFRVNLTGTGMAFPWKDIVSVDLANSNIVEDMAMGVELISKNRGAIFLEVAKVNSFLPATQAASESQRTRWEHGHLHTVVSVVPRLFWKAICLRRPGLIVNALDLAVPPLSLFCVINIVWLLVLAVVSFMSGSWILFQAYIFLVIGCFAGIGVAWYRFSRHVVPVSIFLAVPSYVFGKLSIYRRFLGKRVTEWVRTDRDG